MRSTTVLALWLAGTMVVATGCSAEVAYESPAERTNRAACGAKECHGDVVGAQSLAVHAEIECVDCHKGTGDAHASDPKANVAATDWRIESCRPCHDDEAVTYLYDDNARVGPFGGSIRVPPQPKSDTFPQYKKIVAGHAFAKDYNEEGAHSVMLEDHYATTRGKFEACMQCKSTKVAYAWLNGKPLNVPADTQIVLTHTASATAPAKKVLIPKGTTITYKTDPKDSTVDAKATFPDGTVWTSKPAASDDATKNFNMLWASTVAATKDTWPYGAGCNHCHDPHTGERRLVRQAMLGAIEGSGGPKGTGGVNPYASRTQKDWERATQQDQRILTCAQCHVEYVCGKSGVDKIDRDAFGWTKAKDLHEHYTNAFGYTQDWKQAIMGEPLIKSQHPETELYWESVHYDAGASCSDCHMPELTGASGRTFRSHWFTSPYKYGNASTWQAFAAKTGVNADEPDNPCARCHSDRTRLGIEQQKTFYARQAKIESLLAESVDRFGALKALKDGGGDVNQSTYEEALAAHRKAHVLWENIAVSENSMGFHNFEESMDAMAEAETQVRLALKLEAQALKK